MDSWPHPRPKRWPGPLRCLVAGWLIAFAAAPAGAASRVVLEFRDAVSGQPTEVRVRAYGPEGWFFDTLDPELLSHHSSRTGYYVHATDSLVLEGPPGNYWYSVSRGLTSVPRSGTVEATTPRRIQLPMAEWIDPRLDGWYASDPHIHLFHDDGLDYDRVPPDRAALIARAEGLDLLHLLENDPAWPGGALVPAPAGTTLVWGQEYRNSFWGHVVLLGLDQLVLWNGVGCCGTLLPAWPTLTWTFANESTGLSILAHPHPTGQPLAPFDGWPGSGFARERAALALTNGPDAFAVASASNGGDSWAVQDYLDALRFGARWAAVGEGDRPLDRFRVTPPGQPRTYAQVGPGWIPGDPALAAAWRAAVVARRSFATTGPIIRRLAAGAVPMGDELDLGAPGTVTVDLSVAAYAPLRRVALHGATGIHWESLLPGAATQMDTTLTIEVVHDDFVVLEVEADEQGWPELEFPPRALSSPVWIHTGTPWPRDPVRARSNADALEAFFDQAAVLRGFDSSVDSLAAAVDILGAAAAYEAMFDDPPAEFALLAPADGADVAGATTPLQWSESVSHDGEAVVYRVRVARDATFADLLVEEFTASNQFTLEAVSGPGSYHWQVEALEPGDPPTPATSGPRSVYLSGPVVAAPPAAPSAVPLELRGPGSDGFGASVSLRLARPMSVQLRWIDVRGREVARRALGHREAGTHVLYFPGHDGEGQPFARGVYWLIAEGGGARDVLRVVWLR